MEDSSSSGRMEIDSLTGGLIQEKRDKLQALKRKIVWEYCEEKLMDPPLPFLNPLTFSAKDSEADRRRKQAEYDRELAELTDLRRKREPELLRRFDDIIERVRRSRNELLDPKLELHIPIAKSDLLASGTECPLCGNTDPQYFSSSHSSGDTVCMGLNGEGCGNVVGDHSVDQNQEFRVFEGDVDQNHQAMPPDKFMSEAENTSTRIVGTDATAKKLLRKSIEVEKGLSNLIANDRRTTTFYKDQQKKAAFDKMYDTADHHGIHYSILEFAKEEYSRYRDIREHVNDYEPCVGACLILAYERLLAEAHDDDTRVIETPVETYRELVYRPQAEVKSNDIAVTTLENLPMTVWSVHETREWLLAVLSNRPEDDSLKTKIVDALINRLVGDDEYCAQRSTSTSSSSSIEQNQRIKQLLAPMPGDNRAKLFKETNQLGRVRSASDDFGVSCPGKRLACSNITKLLSEALSNSTIDRTIIESVAMQIHSAIKTRGQHGVIQYKDQKNIEFESRRQRIEKSGPLGEKRARALSFPVIPDVFIPTGFNVNPQSDAPSAADEFLMIAESNLPSLAQQHSITSQNMTRTTPTKKISPSVSLASINNKTTSSSVVEASVVSQAKTGVDVDVVKKEGASVDPQQQPPKKKKPKIVIS